MSKEQANSFKKHRSAEDPQGNLAWAARLGQKALRAGPEALARIDVEREFELDESERVLWRLVRLPRKYLDLEHAGVLTTEKCRAFFRGLVAADVVDIVDTAGAKALLPAEVKRLRAEIAGKELARPAALKAKVYRPDIDGTGGTGGQPAAGPEFDYVDANGAITSPPTAADTSPRGVPAPNALQSPPSSSASSSASSSGNNTTKSPTSPRGVVAPGGPLDTEQRMFKEEIDRAYGAMPKQNHYEFMGLSRGADDASVRQAYMRMAREFHPDKVANSSFDGATKEKVDALFKRLQEAHDSLKESEGRGSYDRKLDALGDGGSTTTGAHKRQRRPMEANSAFKMAETFFKRKDMIQAEAHYRQAFNFDPEDAKIATALAFCIWLNPDHDEAQRTAEARKRLTEIVNQHKFGDAAYKLGLLLRKGNDEAGAQRQFSLAHKLDPAHTDAQREVRLSATRHAKTKQDQKDANSLFGRVFKK